MSVAPARGLSETRHGSGPAGLRAQRGRCIATCWLAGAGKSLLKAVGATVEDDHNVFVVSRLPPASFSISHVIPS